MTAQVFVSRSLILWAAQRLLTRPQVLPPRQWQAAEWVLGALWGSLAFACSESVLSMVAQVRQMLCCHLPEPHGRV